MTIDDVVLVSNVKSQMSNVVTRFAPSPTGPLHVGSARTALFNYSYAKKHGGTFVLRIEDTDRARSRPEFEKDIHDGLAWLGLVPDTVHRQSERANVYEKYIAKLLESDAAYESTEERDGAETTVIRFRNPGGTVSFTDEVRGEISMTVDELGDFVVARSRREPLYHLAVVIDDYDMGITHVIRGEDHISNTPRQVLLQNAIGASEPVYAHLPLILAPDKSKLSKRHGTVSVNEYQKEGYMPEAMVNFLALLGWHPGDDKEIFTLNDLIHNFDFTGVQKGGAVFDKTKLDWINREHLKSMSQEELNAIIARELRLEDEQFVEKITPVILERIHVVTDIQKMMNEGEWSYFFKQPEYEPSGLVWKNSAPEDTRAHLAALEDRLQKSDFSSADSVKDAVWNLAEEKGKGDVLWPFRYALSGRERSPDPFTLAYILGREETLKRLKTAIKKLS